MHQSSNSKFQIPKKNNEERPGGLTQNPLKSRPNFFYRQIKIYARPTLIPGPLFLPNLHFLNI